MKNKKEFLLGMVVGVLFCGTTVYASTKYLASDVTYKDTTVEKALNDLYNTNSINYNNLKKITGTKVDVEIGKKYLIVFSVGSHSTQNYKPSIVSGCTIEKETEMLNSNFDVIANHTSAYIVTATSDTIIFEGNLSDTSWNHIIYYKF